MSTTTHPSSRWLFLLLIIILIGLFWWGWPRSRAAVYRIYRERGRSQSITALSGYTSKSSENLTLYFTDADRDVTDMVLNTAEMVYGPVVTHMGHRPTARVALILDPSRDQLRSAFGWGSGESALGVYWSGTIRLLSPNVWIDGRSAAEQRRLFQQENPIAHELTHYLLDYMADGNYPRWFTEGLAQWVEHRVTGYLWIEPMSTLRQPLYSLADLDQRFDRLENQPLAYRQSFLLVDYVATTYGDEGLSELIGQLSDGRSFAKAVERVLGISTEQLYARCSLWIDDHLEELDAAN